LLFSFECCTERLKEQYNAKIVYDFEGLAIFF